MGLSFSEAGYDRTRVLEAAARTRARRRPRRAIALYRWVLAHEPENADLHRRLAPLLAETGQRFDAWWSYRTAARSLVREGRLDPAVAVYREAADRLGGELDVWLELAEVQRRHGRQADAVQSLHEARRRFRGRGQRPQAIHLLRRLRGLEPRRIDLVIELARLLARSGQRPEALLLLERAEGLCEGARLRRVRAARFRLSWRLRDAWRWLRASRRRGAPALLRAAG